MSHFFTLPTKNIATVAFATIAFISACSPANSPLATLPKTPASASPSASPSAAPAAKEAPHFTYEGEEGPEHWGDLSPDFAPCKNGKAQTPIDVATAGTLKESLAPIQFNYKPSAVKILNNGHTIQANYEAGSAITVGTQTYQLAQYHFHTPSEHTINGKKYDMEMHLVHKNDAGQLAVVGIMMEKGNASSWLPTLWNNLPDQINMEKLVTGASFNVKDALPSEQKYYNYAGSLTTPPCSEGVNWLLMKSSVTLSADQLSAFQKLYKLNARPVQPLNGRTVKESN